MASGPRYIQLVPAAPEGVIEAAELPWSLPYGLQPRDFFRTVEDVHDLIHRQNTVLHDASYPPLERLLDPAGFSGLISRTIASRLAAASKSLVVNGFHNGYPDLIVRGQYPYERVQRGEGLEIKATRSESNWQSHGPRAGWFVWVQFALDDRDEVALFDREPTHVQSMMAAELTESDWSWQPAGEGRIRSGTATVRASGRAKLRAGAIWVAPDYADEHARLLSKGRLDTFSGSADEALLSALAAASEPLTAIEAATAIASAFGLDGDQVLSRVKARLSRLKKAGRVSSPKRGTFRVGL